MDDSVYLSRRLIEDGKLAKMDANGPAVLLMLAGEADSIQVAHPAIPAIAQQLGISCAAVWRSIDVLVSLNLITQNGPAQFELNTDYVWRGCNG